MGEGARFDLCTFGVYGSEGKAESCETESGSAMQGGDVMEWISVDERLPEYDRVVLICRYNNHNKETRQLIVSYAMRSSTDSAGEHWHELTFDMLSIWVSPTHWMPLPDPPAVEEVVK
jgi:hypothetical protein